MNTQGIQHTALFELHQNHGAKMVPFAGYSLPIQYSKGIIKEHLHTRQSASLFDVSHMGQVKLHGDNAALALETLVPVDIVDLSAMQQRYALFTNEAGGIEDDLMVTNAIDHLFVVVNADCKEKDIAYMREKIGKQCDIEELTDHSLLALQGPKSAEVLKKLTNFQVDDLLFMQASDIAIGGIDCFVTRSGYSGEDGFEISVADDKVETLARLLLEQDEVEPAGLGARDSLRLEAGLCLYGQDLTPDTTPVEASLIWALSKSRRAQGIRPLGYPGAQIIDRQLTDKPDKKRVGLKPQGRAPIRQNTQLTDSHGTVIGHVTSGSYGASVNGPVAMGYVKREFAAVDTQIQALVRGKSMPVSVSKLPFVQQRYYRG